MSVHIWRQTPHAKDGEAARLAACSKGELRRLKRYVCGACEKQLHRAGCQEIDWDCHGGSLCSEATRIKRIDDCLADYRPRNPGDPS